MAHNKPTNSENSVARLMSELDQTNRNLVLSIGKQMDFQKGELLFQQGDPGDAMYVVKSGGIEISILSEEGKKLSLNVMQPGDVFGEIAALDGGQRTATAMAAEKSSVTKYTRKDLVDLVGRNPDMALKTIALLCERIRWINQQVEDLAMLDVEGRLANRLLLLYRKFADETGRLKMSQAEIADFLGVSRESINKVLQNWRSSGYIALGRGSIQIKRPADLEMRASLS